MKHAVIIFSCGGIFFLLLSSLAVDSMAQSTQSNCVVTEVGSPNSPASPPPECGNTDSSPPNSNISPPPGGNPPTGIADDFVKAAQQVKAAYDGCAVKDGYPAGDTHERPGLADCLHEYYVGLGYSQEHADAMEIRRGGTLVGSPNPGTYAAACTQCLGYVSLAAVLWTGSIEENEYLGYGSASDMFNLDSFRVGDNRFIRIGVGNEVSVQPGDIGVRGDGVGGHIVVVKEVKGNVSFVALESNFDITCQITDNHEWLKEGFAFFRKE